MVVEDRHHTDLVLQVLYSTLATVGCLLNFIHQKPTATLVHIVLFACRVVVEHKTIADDVVFVRSQHLAGGSGLYPLQIGASLQILLVFPFVETPWSSSLYLFLWQCLEQ